MQREEAEEREREKEIKSESGRGEVNSVCVLYVCMSERM